MFSIGDLVICKDTSGFSVLEVEVGKTYTVEEVGRMCYIRLQGIKDLQKSWRFEKVGTNVK